MPAAIVPLPDLQPEPDLHGLLLAEAKRAIAAHPRVFLARGRLVEVVDDRTRTWLEPLCWTRVSALLWLSGPWQAFLAEHELRSPGWLPSEVLREKSWPDVRSIAGITDLPVLRPDGTLLTTPGYDEATGLWFAPSQPLPDLPAAPTQADARAAVEELDRLLNVFPLVSKAHRSAMLAALLTPFARSAFEGPAPLFLLDAPGEGLGAVQAADILGGLLCGGQLARLEKPPSERQFRRQLTKLQTPDNGLVLIEGAEGFRAAASLSTALMDWHWTDGSSPRERRRLTWFARSSNATLTRDAAEGILPIRFLDTCDHFYGTSFVWPRSLDAWSATHRAAFVRSALVLLRAYVCAGKPAQEGAAWPRVEGWRELLCGAFVWAGFDDPLLARRALAAAIGDEEAAGLHMLVRALALLCPPRVGLTTRYIVERCRESELWQPVRTTLQEMLGTRPLDARHVGNLLSRYRGVSVEGLFLHRAGSDEHSFARWTVERSPLVARRPPIDEELVAELQPNETWFREGAIRFKADDPRPLLDRVGDYPIGGEPTPRPVAPAAVPQSESSESDPVDAEPTEPCAGLIQHVPPAPPTFRPPWKQPHPSEAPVITSNHPGEPSPVPDEPTAAWG